MQFNLEDLNPGTWFLIDEKNPDQGRICLRLLNGKARKEIDKETVTKDYKFHPQTHQRYEDVQVDEGLNDRMLWDYSIVDWDGIEDNDGQPIPCTADNKIALIHGSPLFMGIMLDCQARLIEAMALKEKETEKN